MKKRKKPGSKATTKKKVSSKKTRSRKGSIVPRESEATIRELYRPLKKPITVRIDADVLAWFKKDGKRYQTRINGALRKVMERELKAGR